MTARDIDQAWRLIEFARKDVTRPFRQALAEEIAAILAELRKAKKAK